jgi:hypothetical protein
VLLCCTSCTWSLPGAVILSGSCICLGDDTKLQPYRIPGSNNLFVDDGPLNISQSINSVQRFIHCFANLSKLNDVISMEISDIDFCEYNDYHTTSLHKSTDATN